MSADTALAEIRRKCAEYNALRELLVVLDERSGAQDDSAAMADRELAELIRSHVQSIPVWHPDRAAVCEQIRCALRARAEHAGWDSQERKACTELAFELERLHPAGDPDRYRHTFHLALLLELHIEDDPSSANIAMWEAVVQLLKETLALQDDGHAERYKSCRCLADVLKAQHESAGDPNLLVEAELYYREALTLQTIHDSERHHTCGRLASLLRQIHGDSLRDEVVLVYKEALALPSSDRLGRELALGQMGTELLVLFRKTDDVFHLEESIQASRDALAMQPSECSQRDWWRTILASALGCIYHATSRGDLQLVDEAIQLHREVLRCRPVGHLHRPLTCLSLGAALFDQFENTGDRSSLDESIQFRFEALTLPGVRRSDEDHLRRYLTHSLFVCYRLTGNGADLDAIIGLQRKSLAACPPGHPDRFDSCKELSKALIQRTYLTADMVLLDEAVALRREMHALQPIGHPDRYSSCHDLAEVLLVRSEITGTGGDASLNEAIQLSREALALQPADYTEGGLLRSTLGLALSRRWSQTGDHAILNESIHLNREALELRPTGHPDRHLSCMVLASALLANSSSFTIALLEESSHLLKEAMALQHEQHHHQWNISCGSLAVVLLHQSALTDDGAYLDEAIQLSRKVLDLRPMGHPYRWTACLNLATALHNRLLIKGDESVDASDEMQDICNEVLRLCPPGHPSRWRCLVLHAKLSMIRRDPAGAVLDLSEAMSDPYTDGVPEMLTVFLAMVTIVHQPRSLAPNSQQTLLNTYERAVDLTIITAGFAPDHSFQLKRVEGGTTIGPRALVLAKQRGDLAAGLRILERARGVIWSQMLHVRDPQIDLVPAALAIQLQDLLCSASTSSAQREGAGLLTGLGTFLSDRDVRHQQHIQLQDVLRQIRSLPGLHDYMRGPDTQSLLMAAERNVVVVLVADETESYALIIRSSHEPLAVVTLAVGEEALRGLEVASSPSRKRGSFDEYENDNDEDHRAIMIFKRRVTSMASLAKLWRLVVDPVLSHLQLIKQQGRSRPRLHWCPTGAFAFVPMHAAGIYDGSDQQCCADYVVSSYTPTLSALLRAQQTSTAYTHQELRVLTIAAKHSHDPVLPSLHFVDQEIDGIAELTAKIGLAAEALPRLATKDTIASALEAANVVHLACHGIQDPSEPHESHFSLESENLTVSDLMGMDLKHAFVAFLSACETAKGDRMYADEVVHLAATMLFAGFKSVIATMWVMGDRDGPFVAKQFYEQLFTAEVIDADAVAYALDHAVTELRYNGAPPERWATFIHMGA